MTEAEWLRAGPTSITLLVNLVGHKVSSRKSILFVCACCYRLWPLLPSDQFKNAVEAAERQVDDTAAPSVLPRVPEAVREAYFTLMGVRGETWEERHIIEARTSAAAAVLCLDDRYHGGVAHHTSIAVKHWARSRRMAGRPPAKRERETCLRLLRCVYGNPFRPTPLDPSWLTPTVVALAEGIYSDRAFDRLPILADALEEAGCNHADVLAHCRSDGPHVRGCWVVDLLTGRN